MGEALMPRRGGGGVKTGLVSSVSTLTMTDPALIGARNAIILLNGTSETGAYTINEAVGTQENMKSRTVFKVVIADGVLSFIHYCNAEGKNSHVTDAATFDATTGTITLQEKTYQGYCFSIKVNGNSISVSGEYRYYVWN